ncbi:MAG: hypothetical protein A4S09_00565 [Proteobacteria bacterium SG_bin7]|nr:MAG: hypothetical protein A4S09_00565 [Proteobacteria bacterium SG_bin7]
MKTLRWSHSQILSDFSDCENLRDLIDAIELKCKASSALVCSIRVNGMTLEEEDETRFANTMLKVVNEIEVEVGNITEIVEGIFVNYINWIPYLREVAEDVAESLRAGNMNVAQRGINEMTDALTDLVNSLIELKKTKTSVPQITQMGDIDKLEGALVKIVKELTGAFESSDYVLAADVVEYDLNNLLDDLKTWVDFSRKELGGGSHESNAGAGEVLL